MVFALAALSALEMVQSLTSPKASSSQATGFSQAAANPFDLSGAAATSTTSSQASGASGVSPLSPATMSALLAAQSQSSPAATPAPTDPNAALNDLFSQLDATHDGKITKSEFEDALGAGGTNLAQADQVFGKLDKSGNGITIDDLSSALKGKGHHHHSHAASSTGANADPLLQALSGASGNSVTNSDGSTTTSITYADGSKVTMTSPAAKASSSSATSPYNFLEQMIAREAQAMSSAASQSLSISV
ncbi:MAG: EF-hand domain-containing protein [Bradyrhizobium sp.]